MNIKIFKVKRRFENCIPNLCQYRVFKIQTLLKIYIYLYLLVIFLYIKFQTNNCLAEYCPRRYAYPNFRSDKPIRKLYSWLKPLFSVQDTKPPKNLHLSIFIAYVFVYKISDQKLSCWVLSRKICISKIQNHMSGQ